MSYIQYPWCGLLILKPQICHVGQLICPFNKHFPLNTCRTPKHKWWAPDTENQLHGLNANPCSWRPKKTWRDHVRFSHPPRGLNTTVLWSQICDEILKHPLLNHGLWRVLHIGYLVGSSPNLKASNAIGKEHGKTWKKHDKTICWFDFIWTKGDQCTWRSNRQIRLRRSAQWVSTASDWNGTGSTGTGHGHAPTMSDSMRFDRVDTFPPTKKGDQPN